MAVPAPLTASTSAVAFVAVVLAATPAVAQVVCKSTDARGNVTYKDCPSTSTYSPQRRPPAVEEESPAPDTIAKPRESAGKSREPARALPGATAAGGPAPPAPARQTYPIAGVPLLIVGMVVALVSSINFLVEAFRKSLWWGMGCVFLSPLSLLFLVRHWNVARRPFFVSLAGLAAALVGYVLLGGGT